MLKTFKSSRKKSAKKSPRTKEISEPIRKSLLDVVKGNFKLAKRQNFVHRYIYIGEHCFEKLETLVETMRKNIGKVNGGYCPESLTGIFLYYERYFCHIIEGDQDVLNEHLRMLLQQNEDSFKDMKLLCAIHHINARFVSEEWYCYHGKPAVRLEDIDPNSDMENSMRYVKNCSEMLYGFARALLEDLLGGSENRELPRFSRVSTYQIDDTRSHETASSHTAVEEKDPFRHHLPELKLLDFLIHSKHLKDIREVIAMHGKILEGDNYYDDAWPIPSESVPNNIFSKAFDPVTALPTKQAIETTTSTMMEQLEIADNTERAA